MLHIQFRVLVLRMLLEVNVCGIQQQLNVLIKVVVQLKHQLVSILMLNV